MTIVCKAWGCEFWVLGFWFLVWVRDLGFGFEACLGFGVWGLGFEVWGLGFGVWGLGVASYLGCRCAASDLPYLKNIESLATHWSHMPHNSHTCHTTATCHTTVTCHTTATCHTTVTCTHTCENAAIRPHANCVAEGPACAMAREMQCRI